MTISSFTTGLIAALLGGLPPQVRAEGWAVPAAKEAGGIVAAGRAPGALRAMAAAARPRREEPGLCYGPYYGTPRCSMDEEGWPVACDIDYLTIEAKVGWPFQAEPLAKCVGGRWTMDTPEVVWGSLPPGLWVDNRGWITGTPRSAGIWHFTVKFPRVYCGASHYGNRIQYLTIQTGTPTHPPYPGS